MERGNFLNSLTDEKKKKLTEEIKQECENDNHAYALRFIETGLKLEHNFHIFDCINSRIPKFEESKHSYITDKLIEKGFYAS
jgi:hypothetical protein